MWKVELNNKRFFKRNQKNSEEHREETDYE